MAGNSCQGAKRDRTGVWCGAERVQRSRSVRHDPTESLHEHSAVGGAPRVGSAPRGGVSDCEAWRLNCRGTAWSTRDGLDQETALFGSGIGGLAHDKDRGRLTLTGDAGELCALTSRAASRVRAGSPP